MREIPIYNYFHTEIQRGVIMRTPWVTIPNALGLSCILVYFTPDWKLNDEVDCMPNIQVAIQETKDQYLSTMNLILEESSKDFIDYLTKKYGKLSFL